MDRHGIPSLFLTLTADEVSELRWPEVEQMENKLKALLKPNVVTWQDMPCEMARLFADRVRSFMEQHVLSKTRPILGRVLHWMVRFESQVSILAEGVWACCFGGHS